VDVRAISTVVDATVFLLLVGGAIATLVAGTGTMQTGSHDHTGSGNPAAEDARLLATTTATVNYSLAPATVAEGDEVTFHRTEGTGFERTAHGTLASLLAEATVGNVALDGEQLSHAGDQFERRLASTVRDRLGRPGIRTSVEATWEPYDDATLAGSTRVGDEPPRDVDVHAATLTVDSGFPASRDRAGRAAEEDGFRGVATVVADAVVSGLFPPRETQLALRGTYPGDALTAQRYRRAAMLFGAEPPAIEETNVSASNDGLRTVLADRFVADLESRFDSPRAAARAVETKTVDVTVRTWSP
jgi:hypothetical protein